jgi:hypothetical protein
MARPRKTGLDYFSLDTNFETDDKIVQLLYKHGNAGLGIIIRLWARAYNTANGELDFSTPEYRKGLSRQFGITEKHLLIIIESATNCGLFDTESWRNHNRITSKRIQKQIESVKHKRDDSRADYEQKQGVSATETLQKCPVSGAESKIKESKIKESKINKNKDVFILPDWIDKELWGDFLEVRRVKKAPNTNRAIKLLITELTGLRNLGFEPQKIIEQSIKNGWRGLFPLKENKNAANSKDVRKNYSTQFSTDYEDPETHFAKQRAANV